jgi:hypothetical protein
MSDLQAQKNGEEEETLEAAGRKDVEERGFGLEGAWKLSPEDPAPLLWCPSPAALRWTAGASVEEAALELRFMFCNNCCCRCI